MTEGVTTRIEVNGREITRAAPAHFTLLRWLRDAAEVHDVKYGCGEGVCGACTVLVDGAAISSCLVLATQVDGQRVTTVSGLTGETGELNALQQAFLDHGASQCGFCTPGMLLAAKELLDAGERPDRDGLREALHGNLCRCTGYASILDAIEAALGGRQGGADDDR